MRKIKSQSGAVELVWGKFYAASRLQHASRNMRHAKIKSGFTTEGTEFTEGELRSVAVLAVGAPLEGRTKPGIKSIFITGLAEKEIFCSETSVAYPSFSLRSLMWESACRRRVGAFACKQAPTVGPGLAGISSVNSVTSVVNPSSVCGV